MRKLNAYLLDESLKLVEQVSLVVDASPMCSSPTKGKYIGFTSDLEVAVDFGTYGCQGVVRTDANIRITNSQGGILARHHSNSDNSPNDLEKYRKIYMDFRGKAAQNNKKMIEEVRSARRVAPQTL